MASRLYSPTHKQWDHTGFIFPEVEISDSTSPPVQFKPADWLPVVRQDTKYEDWIVIMPGKVVATDLLGNVVPAGYRIKFEVAGASTALTYTADDYGRTVDLTTGSLYATNGTTNYTQTQVTDALIARGLIRATEYARDFINKPIGYAPYAMVQWCGGDGMNPANFRQHNYCRQHQVAVKTDANLQMPLVPAAQATETMGDGSISNSAITFGTSQWHSATGLHATTRYASLVAVGNSVVGYVFGKYPVAKNSNNTAMSFSTTGLTGKTEVESIAAVLAGGANYYYVDWDAGVLFVYSSGGTAVPTGFTDGTTTVTYYHYESAGTSLATIAMATGDLVPGDFVTFDTHSNYVEWVFDIGTCTGGASGECYAADPTYDSGSDDVISAQLEAAITQAITWPVAQVVGIVTGPVGALETVRTHYTGLTATERMPGSATGGQTDAQNLSGASFKTVILNFLAR